MTDIPEDEFDNGDNYYLGKKVLRKMAMNRHDKSDPVSLGYIQNTYLIKDHPDSRLLQIMTTMVGCDIPINGKMENRIFWLEEELLKNPVWSD